MIDCESRWLEARPQGIKPIGHQFHRKCPRVKFLLQLEELVLKNTKLRGLLSFFISFAMK